MIASVTWPPDTRIARPLLPAWAWMAAAFLAGLAMVAGVVLVAGTGAGAVHLALRLTARLGFVPFWLAYGGGGLALLAPAFGWVRRHGREFGLAFAAVLLVHLGLIAWLCVIGDAPDRGTFLFFGSAAAWVFVLALFSIPGLRAGLGARAWWLLRAAGMGFVDYAFAVDFLRIPPSFGIGFVVLYAPFVALCGLAPILWLTAVVLRR